jgi:hypothetical protein
MTSDMEDFLFVEKLANSNYSFTASETSEARVARVKTMTLNAIENAKITTEMISKALYPSSSTQNPKKGKPLKKA